MKSYDGSYLREVILGKVHFRQCPICYGTGEEHWRWTDANEADSLVISPQEYADTKDDLRGLEECSVCFGVGFVESYREDE